jgi:ankyrin repeat protein
MIDDGWFDREQLHLAASDGDLPRVEQFVADGCDINAFDDLGKTPLHYAAERGHLGVATFLLGCGADVNAHHEPSIGNTPLGEIAGECSLEMARLLVESGADPTIRGWMQLNALDRAKARLRGEGPLVYALLVQATSRLST